jgi:receptor-type tyrosine-protein phosphatase gamma
LRKCFFFKIKCDQYWPDEGTAVYGNIQVTHLQTICLAFYTKRIFTVKTKQSKKRGLGEMLVYQYHFTDWPDHGVPYYILPVLTFIKKSSRANPEQGGPIVVHCSAGVGRTGTYIVIDAMMKQIVHKSTINVHTFLKHIRNQRNYLVQTEEQFIFIYDVLLESLKSGETELNEVNFRSYLGNLARLVVNAEGAKLLDRQFQLITEFKPNEYQVSAALMPFNATKNRTQFVLPVNNSRVVLSRRPGVDGSEYINATYLHVSKISIMKLK